MADGPKCQWTNLQDACAAFVKAESGVQGSHHIRPLHWYVACQLVVKGGFVSQKTSRICRFVLSTTATGLDFADDPRLTPSTALR